MKSEKSRRDFLKVSLYGTGAAIIGAGIVGLGCSEERPTSSKYMGDFVAPKLNKIRYGFIGVEARGSGYMFWAAGHKGAEVVAIADPHIPTVEKRLE